MFRREISLEDVKVIIQNGEIIREYSDDRPYPSFLLLGFIDHRPLPLLVAKETETGRCVLVTVYEPDTDVWSDEFKPKIR